MFHPRLAFQKQLLGQRGGFYRAFLRILFIVTLHSMGEKMFATPPLAPYRCMHLAL